MSVYDREWYRKEQERGKRRQEGSDAMWNEVEPSHRTNNSSGSKKTPQTAPPKLKKKPAEKLILTSCPHCDYRFQVRVSLKRIHSFKYTCPSCSKKIIVRTTTTADKIITGLLYVLGIPASLLILLSSLQNFFPNILNLLYLLGVNNFAP